MKNLTGISFVLILQYPLARILIALSLPSPPYLCYWTGSWRPGCLAWWIYHEKFNRNFICFDFAVPACQDFDCSLPTLPSLFVLLNRVMAAWMPCMGAYGWVVGLFAMETVQWNLYSGRTPSGLRQVSPELRLGWGLLIINQQTKYYYFSRKRHLLL